MKRLSFFALSIFLSVTICISFAGKVFSQETEQLQVTDSAICLDIVDRECTGAATNFPASVGKLYCLTKIVGANNPTQITHVWYYGHTERARITLGVRTVNWRTYSSKLIQVHEIGDWHIDVLGPKDEFLKVIQFEIGP
jgi:hypothetical protein